MTDIQQPPDDPYGLVQDSWPPVSETATNHAAADQSAAATTYEQGAAAARNAAEQATSTWQGRSASKYVEGMWGGQTKLTGDGDTAAYCSQLLTEAAGEIRATKRYIVGEVNTSNPDIAAAKAAEEAGQQPPGGRSSQSLIDEARQNISDATTDLNHQIEVIGKGLERGQAQPAAKGGGGEAIPITYTRQTSDEFRKSQGQEGKPSGPPGSLPDKLPAQPGQADGGQNHLPAPPQMPGSPSSGSPGGAGSGSGAGGGSGAGAGSGGGGNSGGAGSGSPSPLGAGSGGSGAGGNSGGSGNSGAGGNSGSGAGGGSNSPGGGGGDAGQPGGGAFGNQDPGFFNTPPPMTQLSGAAMPQTQPVMPTQPPAQQIPQSAGVSAATPNPLNITPGPAGPGTGMGSGAGGLGAPVQAGPSAVGSGAAVNAPGGGTAVNAPMSADATKVVQSSVNSPTQTTGSDKAVPPPARPGAQSPMLLSGGGPQVLPAAAAAGTGIAASMGILSETDPLATHIHLDWLREVPLPRSMALRVLASLRSEFIKAGWEADTPIGVGVFRQIVDKTPILKPVYVTGDGISLHPLEVMLPTQVLPMMKVSGINRAVAADLAGGTGGMLRAKLGLVPDTFGTLEAVVTTDDLTDAQYREILGAGDAFPPSVTRKQLSRGTVEDAQDLVNQLTAGTILAGVIPLEETRKALIAARWDQLQQRRTGGMTALYLLAEIKECIRCGWWQDAAFSAGEIRAGEPARTVA